MSVNKADYIATDADGKTRVTRDYWIALALEACPDLDGEDDEVLEALGRAGDYCIACGGRVDPRAGVPMSLDLGRRTQYGFAHETCADRAATHGNGKLLPVLGDE